MGMLCVLTLNQGRELLPARLTPVPRDPLAGLPWLPRGRAGQLDSASQPDDLGAKPRAWKSPLSPADHTDFPDLLASFVGVRGTPLLGPTLLLIPWGQGPEMLL